MDKWLGKRVAAAAVAPPCKTPVTPSGAVSQPEPPTPALLQVSSSSLTQSAWPVGSPEPTSVELPVSSNEEDMDLSSSRKRGRDSDDEGDAPEQLKGSTALPESKKSAPVPPCPTAEDRAAASTASATRTAVPNPAIPVRDCTPGDTVIAKATDSLGDTPAKSTTGAKAISEVPQKPPLLAALGKTPAAKATSGKPQSGAAFLKDPPPPPTKCLASKKKKGKAASPQQSAPLKDAPTSPRSRSPRHPRAVNQKRTRSPRSSLGTPSVVPGLYNKPPLNRTNKPTPYRPSVPRAAFERGSRLVIAAVLSALPVSGRTQGGNHHDHRLTHLSCRAVRASVREEAQQAKTATQVSYAQARTGHSRMYQSAMFPPGQPPKAAPRTIRAGPSEAATTTTEAPATPPPQACPDPRDQLIASLQLTLKAIGEMLPADSPLRALCLQMGGVPSAQHQHG
nr:proteoglycan 4-like [Dermacentor andersoni]